MIDFREYKDQIRAAVREESKKDKNWNWRVISIAKNAVKIGWGYFDYLEEKEPFVIDAVQDVDHGRVYFRLPYASNVVTFFGNDEWMDAKSFAEAVVKVIHSGARYARSVY